MQQLAEARANGTLLPASHPLTQTVVRIGSKVAAVASSKMGGGNTDHMKVRGRTCCRCPGHMRFVVCTCLVGPFLCCGDHTTLPCFCTHRRVTDYHGHGTMTNSYSTLQDMEWEFAVIRSSIPNAFVVPGGKVRNAYKSSAVLPVYRWRLYLLACMHECRQRVGHRAKVFVFQKTGSLSRNDGNVASCPPINYQGKSKLIHPLSLRWLCSVGCWTCFLRRRSWRRCWRMRQAMCLRGTT